MFYSETLLSKTGPLARVWLAANLERKVLKKDVLQSNIETSVHAIVDQGQAPLALRLSGQLLLGVVRIYSRKARYLLDDCNEAILKIKMAFRPGNVDLPAHQSHTANPASLTLPDVLTELDLLAPMPDASLLLGDSLPDFDNSQRLLSSIDRSRANSLVPLDDTGFGDDFATPRSRRERDIELGRDAPPSMSRLDLLEDTLRPGEGEDLDLDFGEPEPAPAADTSVLPALDSGMDDLAPLGDDDLDLGGFGHLNTDRLMSPSKRAPERGRESRSLSVLRPSVERELERNHVDNTTSLFEPRPDEPEEDETTIQQAQRAKRRRVLQADTDTELRTAQIKAQQMDRSNILKPVSFLPRDPVLLALMEMQRKGGFASSLLGDGMSRGWAPELRGILSLEVVREAGKKRRRDGTAADRAEPEPLNLEFDAEDALGIAPTSEGLDAGEGDKTAEPEDHGSPAGMDDEGLVPMEDDLDAPEQTFGFDNTEAPLVHPDESGPVSLGTKHAVHLLREKFGPEESDSTQQQKKSILFQDLLPEKTTTRADATKMFFEMLVLATKDAIKVEQPSDEVGGPLRVRARRGLWGAWAESTAEDEEAGDEPQAPTIQAEIAV